MKRYEIAINILDKNYIDNLIVAIARQGYDVYFNEIENIVCFTCDEETVTEVKFKRI
jgi:hypothetical protein